MTKLLCSYTLIILFPWKIPHPQKPLCKKLCIFNLTVSLVLPKFFSKKRLGSGKYFTLFQIWLGYITPSPAQSLEKIIKQFIFIFIFFFFFFFFLFFSFLQLAKRYTGYQCQIAWLLPFSNRKILILPQLVISSTVWQIGDISTSRNGTKSVTRILANLSVWMWVNLSAVMIINLSAS